MSEELENQETQIGDSSASDGARSAGEAEIANLSETLASVTAERDMLAAEKAGLEDRYVRQQAEFQNFRRRVEKEKIEWHEYAATEAVRALLPILDDFERALKVKSADKDYSRGMELIYQRLVDALKKLGLEPLVSLGRPFDPHVHHAVEKKPVDDAPDETVIEEHQRGYNFKGRLLRPAMVSVAVAPVSK
jgi:molecular chaperone GrpE